MGEKFDMIAVHEPVEIRFVMGKKCLHYFGTIMGKYIELILLN